MLSISVNSSAPFDPRDRELTELRASLADAQAVGSVLTAVSDSTGTDEVLHAALNSVRTAFSWEYASAWQLAHDEQGPYLGFLADDGNAHSSFVDATRTLKFRRGVGLVGGLLVKAETAFIPDLASLKGYLRAEPARRSHLNAALCIPITGENGEVVAALDFYTRELALSERRFEALRRVGLVVSSNVARQQAREREEREANDLRHKVDLILEVVAAAERGDLTRPITVTGDDAIGRLGTGVGELLGTLRANVASIAGNAQALAAASEELQAVGEQIRESAREGSTNASRASETCGEVTRSVESVAHNAEVISASIRDIAKNASEAARIAKNAVEAAASTGIGIAQVRDSSRKIGDVVRSISGIALQTNMLALNAAIEAAHAGDAGRGFAVVAKDVKELSLETSRATLEIGESVEAMLQSTSAAIASVDDIGKIVQQIASIQATIAAAVQQQSATTSDIARRVTDAARGSRGISTTVSALALSAQGTAAGLAEMQVASADLARMAAELQRLVERYDYADAD